jgi:hypothetical protein
MTLMQRRRALMSNEKTERPVMNPAFDYTLGYIIDKGVGRPYLKEAEGYAATDFIDCGVTGSIQAFWPLSSKSEASQTLGTLLQYREVNGGYTDWWGQRLNGQTKTYDLSANTRYIRFGFDPDTMADMYAYNSTTGQVYYAGINTPYYGKTNING